jgi:hypothetical protein
MFYSLFFLLPPLFYQGVHSILSHRDPWEGKVGIGHLPDYFQIDEIADPYIRQIPNKNSTTYHTYYHDLGVSLKNKIDHIQYHPYWNQLCDSSPNCLLRPILQMNELYYSNPKPKFKEKNLYGAAANLIPHRDCILFNFDGIRVYRVIIGLTENNTDVYTELIHWKLEHAIKKGDYIVFDFDKTMHQVKKKSNELTQRVLLKLHFIVCENCRYNEPYLTVVSIFYSMYYVIARYTEQLGTDPTTFIGFFFGILWEYPFYPFYRSMAGYFYLFCCGFLVNKTNVYMIPVYSALICFGIYICITTGFYVRYLLE